MYKLVLVDADGTLFDYYKAEGYALKEALKYFNYSGDEKRALENYRKINSKLWLDLEMGEITKEKLRTERFKLLFKEFKVDIQVNDFSNYYLSKLGEASFLIEGAEEICRYLSEKYLLTILTNGIKKVQLSRLKGSPIDDYIDYIVISDEVGVNKPDPYIFEYTLKLVNHHNKEAIINKEDIIIIGDSLTSDIQGGLNFGIDTCWLNLHGLENNTGIIPKYEVNNLRELKNIL
jgi:YjjG family noncanonical pyrimidine nucleotidase